jgi:hypothetical protein
LYFQDEANVSLTAPRGRDHKLFGGIAPTEDCPCGESGGTRPLSPPAMPTLVLVAAEKGQPFATIDRAQPRQHALEADRRRRCGARSGIQNCRRRVAWPIGSHGDFSPG